MFRRSRKQAIKRSAVSAYELALQLAQDRKFRKRLLSGLKHSSEASTRTGRGLGVTGAIAQLTSDRSLQRELRSARKDLRGAYRRLETKRRNRRLLRFTALASLASVVAVPQLRERFTTLIAKVPQGRKELTDIASREELYERAQAADIPGRSEMSKQQLVDALRVKS